MKARGFADYLEDCQRPDRRRQGELKAIESNSQSENETRETSGLDNIVNERNLHENRVSMDVCRSANGTHK